MRAYLKSVWRLFEKHYMRLLTIFAIIVVSVGFASGIGEVESKIKFAATDLYKTQNVSDLYVKSKSVVGFSEEEIRAVTDCYGEENVMQSLCMDIKSDDVIFRIIACDFEKWNINKLQILDGETPSLSDFDLTSGSHGAMEVLVERKNNVLSEYRIGDNIALNLFSFEFNFKVTGISLSPLMVYQDEEPSYAYENEHLNTVVYVNVKDLPIVNDLYVTLPERSFNAYADGYEILINSHKAALTDMLGEDRAQVLSLYENIGFVMLIAYAEKVGLISIIFVVFFALVTMLVVYSTMSRLLDEERGQIACLKTLGYSDFGIVFKYVLFVTIGAILGGILAYFVGLGLTIVLYRAFNMQYYMPPLPSGSSLTYYLLTFGTIALSSVILTLITGLRLVGNKPVTLLAHKAPRPGRRVLVERIPFIWGNLSFKYKSSIRNVFLFRSRFYMTVISIMGSTVLVLAGLGLLDNALKMDNADSIITISAALITFSALLCALVIYNITNINVSERTREIATLMVLGYQDNEVTGYIFREIYIMCFIGALLGVPVGAGFIEFAFNLVDFGSLAEVNWWTWIVAPVITLLFGILSSMLLIRKITRTDMSASLKTLE